MGELGGLGDMGLEGGDMFSSKGWEITFGEGGLGKIGNVGVEVHQGGEYSVLWLAKEMGMECLIDEGCSWYCWRLMGLMRRLP